MNILSSWLRRRAIIRYRTKLPYALAKDYGKADTYLPAQVKATVERTGLTSSYLVYALALYCTIDNFETYIASNQIDADYDIANEVVDGVLYTISLGRKDSGLSVASYAGEAGDGGGDGCGGGGE